MKTVIAGGRNFKAELSDQLYLDSLDISEVVSGGATGADSFGEVYASYNHIPVKMFRADWNKHGKAAGPIRNREMAGYADAVVLFSGGKGTQSMFNEATKAGIKIYDRREVAY